VTSSHASATQLCVWSSCVVTRRLSIISSCFSAWQILVFAVHIGFPFSKITHNSVGLPAADFCFLFPLPMTFGCRARVRNTNIAVITYQLYSWLLCEHDQQQQQLWGMQREAMTEICCWRRQTTDDGRRTDGAQSLIDEMRTVTSCNALQASSAYATRSWVPSLQPRLSVDASCHREWRLHVCVL